MPTVRFNQSITTGASFAPNLAPYDRLGGQGGRVRVRAVVDSAGVVGDIVETLFVGSELIENRGALPLERAAGAGPDEFTPGVVALGAPADSIALTFTNVSAGTRSVRGLVEIDNA